MFAQFFLYWAFPAHCKCCFFLLFSPLHWQCNVQIQLSVILLSWFFTDADVNHFHYWRVLQIICPRKTEVKLTKQYFKLSWAALCYFSQFSATECNKALLWWLCTLHSFWLHAMFARPEINNVCLSVSLCCGYLQHLKV